jgi:hypothetical protein
MAATRKEHIMNPLSPSTILRIGLAGAAALVLAAPVGARDSSMLAQYGWGAAATVAKRQPNNPLAKYGWGAAATLAKQQTHAALAASAEDQLLAQYGWGAAATYAKLHA